MKFFDELNVKKVILKGIEKKKFSEMTDIQNNVIPLALNDLDVIAQAPTGTGKTCAYAIPILNKIDSNLDKVQALILAPTRELAVQITDEIREIAFYMEGIRSITIYGGEHIERQILGLKNKPQIIVATPGRLMDHMRRKTIKLSHINTLVLDEADEMLNMGFKEDIDTILESITNNHQTMLFSATFSKEIEKISMDYLHNPEIVRVNKNEITVSTIEQRYIEVKEKDKVEIMSRLIDLNSYKLAIVFCNTKRMVDEVTSNLMTRGFLVEALHGDMKQMQRDRVMRRFKEGTINILVASDVCARGIDVENVDVVFNYDLPTDDEYYVHRIGRTGRAKKLGIAISFVTKQEKYRLRSIMAYSKSIINSMEIPSLEKVMSVRIEKIITQAINANVSSKYQKVINKTIEKTIINDVDAYELISGLITLLTNPESDIDIVEEKEEKTRKSNKKNKNNSESITRMFIGLGKKDNLKIYNLTDMIVKYTNMTNADINNVEMHDDFSFFEIPSIYVDNTIYAFTRLSEKGKRIIVEEAKAKSTKSRKKEKSSKSKEKNRKKKNFDDKNLSKKKDSSRRLK